MPIPPIVPTLDHAVVNVGAELDARADTYRRLGFLLTEKGFHTLGSVNHLAIFEENYLELLGFPAGGATQRADLWKHPPGLTGLVFKGHDPDGIEARLADSAVPFLPAAEFSRPVALGTETRDAKFRVIRVSPELVDNGRVFFCHHYTPDLVWRPEWQAHPNGVTHIAEFVIAAHRPQAAGDLYARMFGADTVRTVPGGVAFAAGKARVSLIEPAAIAQRFNGATADVSDGRDRMVALMLCTRSVDVARDLIRDAGIAVRDIERGFLVSADVAGGVCLGFVEQG